MFSTFFFRMMSNTLSLLSLAILAILAVTSTSVWTPENIGESANFVVPVDHTNSIVGCSGKNLSLKLYRVRDRVWQVASPAHVVIIIPGGPGSSTSRSRARFEYYFKMFPRDTIVYLFDPRGTGNSSRYVKCNIACFGR